MTDRLRKKAELSSEIAIVVEFANGVRVNIGAKATEPLVVATLKALRS